MGNSTLMKLNSPHISQHTPVQYISLVNWMGSQLTHIDVSNEHGIAI